ncbi:MAG TPA: hypothetical protein VNI57_09005, partial [Candidatus Saccharimonadales bacterium]|nr:hypothetical protein [Candidatus Saccharimonadales bacterium]
MALLSSPEYRRDPSSVLHLGLTALLWFTPILAAAALALTPVLALWRPARRGGAPAAGPEAAARWLFRQVGVSVFLFVIVFGLGSFTGSSRDALPLSWEALTGLSALVLAAAGAGIGAAHLLEEAFRSATVARNASSSR